MQSVFVSTQFIVSGGVFERDEVSMDKSKFIKLAWALGKVVYKPLPDRARVLVRLNRLNEIMLMYFPERYKLDVYDKLQTSQIGDLVLIKKLETSELQFETHEIKEIVYPVGAIVDPISGLRVARDKYLFDVDPIEDETFQKFRQSAQDHEFSPKYQYEIKEKELMVKEVQQKKFGEFIEGKNK